MVSKSFLVSIIRSRVRHRGISVEIVLISIFQLRSCRDNENRSDPCADARNLSRRHFRSFSYTEFCFFSAQSLSTSLCACNLILKLSGQRKRLLNHPWDHFVLCVASIFVFFSVLVVFAYINERHVSAFGIWSQSSWLEAYKSTNMSQSLKSAWFTWRNEKCCW